MSTPTPGVCRHCGCGVTRLCRREDGEYCTLDEISGVCNAKACQIAEDRRKQAEAKKLAEAKAARARKHGDKYAGWGYGAVVSDMRKQERRRRKRRAA